MILAAGLVLNIFSKRLFRSNSEKLKNNIDYFKTTFKANKSACNLSLKYIESDSPIQCFIIQGNETVKLIAEKIKGKVIM